MKLYGVCDPKGYLRDVYKSLWKAKIAIFDLQDEDFRLKYWHEAEPAYRAAKKLGWKIEIGEYRGLDIFLK